MKWLTFDDKGHVDQNQIASLPGVVDRGEQTKDLEGPNLLKNKAMNEAGTRQTKINFHRGNYST